MIQTLTKEDIARGQKKLAEVHNFFQGGEKEAVYDFASCLKERMRAGSAEDFVAIYDQAANDLHDESKVAEIYDKSTIGFIRDVSPFIAEKIFGKNFAEEIKQHMLAPSGLGL